MDLTLRHRPDVVVMDVGMPETNGIEAVREIVDSAPEVRIVMLSASISAELRHANVHHDDVRSVAQGQVHGFASGARLREDR